MPRTLSDRLKELDSKSQSESQVDLRQKLERLYRKGNAPKTFPDEQVVRDVRGIHEYVNGSYENTSFGDIFVARREFSWGQLHGSIELQSLQGVSGNWLSRLGKFESLVDFDLESTVFMDTETTGLAGGSGTLAFLIGLGFTDENGFVVQQYFADAFNSEEGMLDLVQELVKDYSTVVTFNGKTYDVPLLSSRYILNRKQSPFDELNHLDLLHPARQIWGYTLEDCRLQTLEREILEFERDDDLPGSEVPAAYFKFLRGQGADPLYRVFEHNSNDILTLGALVPLVWELTRPDGKSNEHQLERARILVRHDEREAAIRVLEKLVASDNQARLRQRGYLELGRLYKKSKNWEQACRQWKQSLKVEQLVFAEPYVDLAIYYEHRIKNFARALDYTEQILSKLTTGRIDERTALEHRRERLRRKIEKYSTDNT